MFEKLQTGEKIHDAPRQPRTCSHPIYAKFKQRLNSVNFKVTMATVVLGGADNHVVMMHGIHYKVSVNSQHEGRGVV